MECILQVRHNGSEGRPFLRVITDRRTVMVRQYKRFQTIESKFLPDVEEFPLPREALPWREREGFAERLIRQCGVGLFILGLICSVDFLQPVSFRNRRRGYSRRRLSKDVVLFYEGKRGSGCQDVPICSESDG